MTVRLTELNSETEWDPDRASANRSRDIKYRPLLPEHNWLFFVLPDLSLPFLASDCKAVSELSFSSWRRGNERVSTKAIRPNENLMSKLAPERRANARCSRRISSSELGALLLIWRLIFGF
jgi:hypothetical protein